MIKNSIQYKIIDDPYAEVGPILIGNKAFSSIGLKIQFFPTNESSWVANLFSHGMALKAVYPLEGSNLLVVAGGLAYIINTDTKEIVTKFGLGYENALENNDGVIILSDPIRITVVSPSGEIWSSQQVSMDGIKDLVIVGTKVSGLAADHTQLDDHWIPFELDIKTGELKGGSVPLLK